MHSPLDTLDAALPRLKLGSTVRDHGWTMLAAVVGVVSVLVLSADFTWGSFDRRQIGSASLQDYDIRARTRLFTYVLAAAVGTFALCAWILPILQRKAGRELFAALEAAFLPSVLLTFLYTFRQYSPSAWALPPAFAILILLVFALERAGLAGRRHADLGRDVLWLGSLAFSCIAVFVDLSRQPAQFMDQLWFVPTVVVSGAVVLLLARGLLARRADPVASAAAYDRIVHALTPLAVLPFAIVAYRELYLILNNRGFTSVTPGAVRIAVFAAIFGWMAWRFARGPRLAVGARVDLERVLGRFVFPWLLVGLCVCSYWTPVILLSDDYFESGNAALTVQQWFDFGKVPFIDTFNAHGLSDCLFAICERFVSGVQRPSWQLWDFLYYLTAGLAVFHLLRVVLASAASAMFAWLCLPYMDFLFHPVPVHALVFVFALAWVVKRSDFRAWWAYGLLLAVAFAWRLDVGFAGTIATLFALPVLRFVVPSLRVPWRTIALAAAATAATAVAFVGALCLARGVNFFGWLRDMAHVSNSNQGFGFTRIADELSEVVLWHLYVLPLAMIVLVVIQAARSRGRVELGTRHAVVLIACVFLAIFTLANFPRGLVRHSFLEKGLAMTSVFTLAVIAFTPAWILPASRPKSILVGFVLISSLLAFNFGLSTPYGRNLERSTTRYERALVLLTNMRRVEYSDAVIDRAPMSDDYDARHLRRMRGFVDEQLTPQQTFFDLSSNPLLYYQLRKPSPYWLNHLLLVYDDYMQQRVLEGWKDWDTPAVLMPFGHDQAELDNVQYWDNIDGVEMRLRLYRIFEHVYANYQPYGQIDRWPVWTRKDWMQPKPPRGVDSRVEFAWTPKGHDGRPVSGDEPATRITLGGGALERIASLPALAQRAYYLRVRARSASEGSIALEWGTGDGQRFLGEKRALRWPAGATELHYLLPGHGGARTFTHLSLSGGQGLELEGVELVSLISREASDAFHRAGTSVPSEWGHVPRLWGEFDEELRRELPVLRVLYDEENSREPNFAMGLDTRSDSDWDAGYHRTRAGIRLVRDDDAAGVTPGDWVLLGDGARIRVASLTGREVWLDGPTLKPPAADSERILLHPARMSKLIVLGDQPRGFDFEPLPRLDERARGQYLVLRVAAHAQRPGQNLVVDYGQGQDNLGRFVFATNADGEPHTYAVRLSTQANWSTRSKNWVSVMPTAGTIQVHSMRIVEAVE